MKTECQATKMGRTLLELETESALRMGEAASSLITSLSAEQRYRLMFPLENPERMKWDYRPGPREGIPLKEMDSSQQKFAFILLSSGMSRLGFAKAMAIMGLEKALKAVEGSSSRHARDPDLYYVSVFGVPSDRSPWGWRMEGHHLSVNYMLVPGESIATTPSFFGANPARVETGSQKGLRVLAAEEDIARRLLLSLDADQLQQTVISEEAPADILTRWEPRVRIDAPSGIACSHLTELQRKMLMDLIHEYVGRMPWEIADRRLERMEKEGIQHTHFAWAGFPEPGKPHYYRIHAPSFLVEYDNTQNNANHIHTVWRDPENDWGEDLLRRHYHRSHEGPE